MKPAPASSLPIPDPRLGFLRHGHPASEFLASISLLLLLASQSPAQLNPGPAAMHGPYSQKDVGSAVQTWVRSVTADARPDAVVERLEPYQVDGETVAFIAYLQDGGFCLAGANDLLLPVYLYSPHGSYNPKNPAYQYILGEMDSRLKAMRKSLAEQDQQRQPSLDALRERAAYWQTLIAGQMPAPATVLKAPPPGPASMVLPLTSHWHQGSPYNDQTPELTPGTDNHTVVGCVATAMAQIMYYWKWPVTGVGSGSIPYDYRWRTTWSWEPLTSDPGIPNTATWTNRLQYNTSNHQLLMNGYWDGEIYYWAQGINTSPAYLTALAKLWDRMTHATTTAYADFGATTYDWSILADRHADPPDAGAQEAAKVSSHAGIAVNMSYGTGTSYSNGGHALAAYKDHFRYDPDAQNDHTDPYTMIAEIQWLRPMQMHGTDARGGHSWVAYGYSQASSQFMMNWGWDDGSDDWYTWDQWFGTDQWHTSRIAPVNVKFVGADATGDGSPNTPYQNLDAALAAVPDGSTLIFKANSQNTFSTSPLIINRPMTLKGYNVTISK
ncbi:MAG: C10 family peptidase [Verrucomicrobia bacterium]|nr:C10 family peptidase [Verrucomicrobiota bacterium]